MYSPSLQRIVFFIFFYRSFINCKSISKRELKNPGKVVGEVFEYAWEPLSKSYEEDRSKIVKVPLQDLRAMEVQDHPKLETDGFTWVSGRPSAEEVDWSTSHSKNRMREQLKADSIEIVKSLTNSKSVVVLSDDYRAHYSSEAGRILPAIHSDMSSQGAAFWKGKLREKLSESKERDQVEFLKNLKQGKDVVIYNVWRPLITVQDNHLGLCKWDSLLKEDAMKFNQNIKSTHFTNSFQPYKYREGQQWYYLSHQKPDEVFVFVQHDSRADRDGMNIPHGSFRLPEDHKEQPTRMSYETSIMAIIEPPLNEGTRSKINRKLKSLVN